jgi:hypothetical protein
MASLEKVGETAGFGIFYKKKRNPANPPTFLFKMYFKKTPVRNLKNTTNP